MKLIGFNLLGILTLLSWIGYCVYGASTESADCQFWHQLAKNLSHIESTSGIQMNCNSTCNSLGCSGNMNINNPVLMSGQKINLDFCFGLQMNHCDNPVNMEYYVDVPSLNFTKNGTISHNDTFTLPDSLTKNLGTLIVAVEMMKVNTTHVLLSATVSAKVIVAGLAYFPVRQQLIPEIYVDVPPCTNKSEVTKHINHPVCTKFVQSVDTTGQGGSGQQPTKAPSYTYKQSCEIAISQCSHNEMCQTLSNLRKNGICVCIPDYHMSPETGFCEADSPVTTSKPSPTSGTTTKPYTAAINGTGTTTEHYTAAVNETGTTAETKTAAFNGTGTTTERYTAAVNETGTTAETYTDAFNETGTTTNPHAAAVNGTGTSSGKKTVNYTVVIIGVVLGSVMLIVVVISVIIYIGHRRRQALYRGRQQLLSDHMDNEDDMNLVV